MLDARVSGDRRAIWCGLLAAVAAGCGNGFGPGGRGELAFDYAGALEGRFAVSADGPAVSVEGVPEFGEWALGAAGDSVGGVVVGGFRVTDGAGDLFVLQLDELRTGAFDCGPSSECHGRVLFGIPDHGGLPPGPGALHYEIVSGTVSVSGVTGSRLRGSFSFVARDEGGAGSDELEVSDGSFDLPLGSQANGGSVVCLGRTASGATC